MRCTIDAIRPGVSCNQIDSAARSVIERAGYGPQFGHNTGHAIGIDVHENPRFSPTDRTPLQPGMVLTGTVRNVIDFGVFVDIGVHQDGLVHISQVSNKFIKHPSEVVSVGDVVKVVVLEVDEKKKRISLSMKQAK